MPSDTIDILLRVVNNRRFQAQMTEAGASVRAFAAETRAASEASSGLGMASSAASSGVNLLGAATRTLATGIGAATAATAVMGIKFNATMESNSLAFAKFTGGVGQAKQFTQELFNMARLSPFSFEDITTAARRFLAFGMSVSDTTGLLKDMGDALAYTGGGTDEILRVTKAFGDIQTRGRLFQQEINQLTNAGIPAVKILKDQLGLTADQMKNIGKAGIDSQTAIDALRRGMRQMFAGGQERYLRTFNGQWQRLTDNLHAAAGAATADLFKNLKVDLNNVNKTLEDPKAQNRFKGMFDAVTGTLGFVAGALVQVGRSIVEALEPATPFLKNILLPLLKGVAFIILGGVVAGFTVLTGLLRIFAIVLGAVGKVLAPLKPLFFVIGAAVALVFGGEILKAIEALGKFGRLVTVIVSPMRYAISLIKNLGGAFAFTWGKIVTFLRGRGMESLANAALRLGIRIGDFLFKGFRGAITRILAAAGGLVAGLGTSLKNWINDHTLFGNTIHLGPARVHIPALATGGTVYGTGMALVGERGPELVTLPSGATVWPAGTGPSPASVAPLRPSVPRKIASGGTTPADRGFSGVRVTLTAPLYLDRRLVGEAMGEYVATKRARR